MRMAIELNAVKIRAKKNRKYILKIVKKVVNRGQFLHGPENKKLTKKLTDYFKQGHVTLTASGHDALFFALKALHLSQMDEVVFPVNAYPTAFPIALSGAKPVPVDINKYGLIDLKQIKIHVNKNTKAVVVVHLYGLPVNLSEIREFLKKRKIVLIEDCAQAFGSAYLNKPVGSFGDISCFSFYPTKNVGSFGDGGTIWAKHKKYHQYFKQAVTYGEKNHYHSEFVSKHSRLSEIQATTINLFLKDMQKEKTKKKEILSYYMKRLTQNSNLLKHIRPVWFDSKSIDPNLHLFVLEVKNRNNLKDYLQKKGIPTAIHYPTPVHLVPSFKYLGYKRGDFPVAERLSKNILSLPFHAYLKKGEVEYIVQSLQSFYHV